MGPLGVLTTPSGPFPIDAGLASIAARAPASAGKRRNAAAAARLTAKRRIFEANVVRSEHGIKFT
jgi:hypothetical protein